MCVCAVGCAHMYTCIDNTKSISYIEMHCKIVLVSELDWIYIYIYNIENYR